MAKRTRLLTILQVSDLHVGEIDPITGNATYSSFMTTLLSNLTWFDGLLGHHARGLEQLAAFLKKLKRAGKKPHLLVSGDLTRMGGNQEFHTAISYIASYVDLHPPTQCYVGLHCNVWKDLAITGNHDLWPGTPTIFGGPGTAFGTYFPPRHFPFVHSIPLANSRTLQFLHIDTDADVSPKGLKRFRAVGSFQNQLTAATTKLHQKRKKEEIRVLVMHHSWHKRGLLLSIDRASRAALNQFLFDYEIQVVLTGHTHKPLVQKFVPQVTGAQPLLECRSGTTTQNDQVAYNWRTFFGTLPKRKWPLNSLLVHTLEEDQYGNTYWVAETYTRTRGSFNSAGKAGKDEVLV